MDIIQVILATIIIISLATTLIKDFKNRNSYKKPKKKKGYDPRNNYFRNSPEHIDMTGSYIDSIWEEIRKK